MFNSDKEHYKDDMKTMTGLGWNEDNGRVCTWLQGRPIKVSYDSEHHGWMIRYSPHKLGQLGPYILLPRL